MSCTIQHEKIQSLQILRALAFLGIFLEHAAAPVSWPKLGVSIFFVLSGFLMVYSYQNRKFPNTIKDCLFFSWTKIRKLYPLHIITMLCAVIIELTVRFLTGWSIKAVIQLILKLLLHIFLIQTWIPYSTVNISLNGVAWYLSVTAFLYAVFPYLNSFVRKHYSRAWFWCIMVVIVQIVCCIPLANCLGFQHPVYIWFMYYFPVFRMGDFLMGCFLGMYYINNDKINNCKNSNASTVMWTIIECALLVITIAVYMWADCVQSTVLLAAVCNWTTVFMLLGTAWVYVFAVQNGYFTRVIQIGLLKKVGDRTSDLFLIHYIVTVSVNIFINMQSVSLSNAMIWTISVIEFLFSYTMADYYRNHLFERLKIE